MTTFLAKLDHRGSLLLEGPDAARFLQGQTTCNLDELGPEHSLVGAYCNPQGRMICDFRLWQLGNERLLMGLEADTVGVALSTFGKYIVFSKASMEDASSVYTHYALWGEHAAQKAQPTSEEAHSSWPRDGVIWTATDMPGVFEACVSADAAAGFEASLADCTPARAEAYRRLEIDAGIGHVTAATSGMFLPQMLNFQHTGRISFNKGCYTGQEVVARMHYRGKVKRPMLVASASGAPDIAPGDALYQDGSDRSVGNVVISVTEDDAVALLASVASDAVESGIRLGTDGPLLSFSDLPYDIESG